MHSDGFMWHIAFCAYILVVILLASDVVLCHATAVMCYICIIAVTGCLPHRGVSLVSQICVFAYYSHKKMNFILFVKTKLIAKKWWLGRILSNGCLMLICENFENTIFPEFYFNKNLTGKPKWFLCFLSHQIIFIGIGTEYSNTCGHC